MTDFDEDKVTRDEHGRFSGGGLGGFVAKHTGKLEGYSKGEGDGGRLQRDPSKEKTALDKWVASKHSIDVDLMGAAKADRNPSTGELSDPNRAANFVGNEIKRLAAQKEALVKEARKAETSRVSYHNKVLTAKYKIEDVTPPYGKEAEHAARVAEGQKVLDKGAERKEKEAGERRDEAHKKLGDVLAQYRSALEAHDVMEKIAGDATLPHRYTDTKDKDGMSFVKDKKDDYRFNVSHDRAGNWEINVHGDTRTEGHPGEKEMTYRVAPGQKPEIKSINKQKAITFAHEGGSLRAMMGRELEPTHSMTMTFPPHKDTGASHPLEGEKSGNKRFTDSPIKHVNSFIHEVDMTKP